MFSLDLLRLCYNIFVALPQTKLRNKLKSATAVKAIAALVSGAVA